MVNTKCHLEIDLRIIRSNYQNLQKIAPKAMIGAAVKANAYGLGTKKIAPVLYNEGCRHFFVCSLDEALSLKQDLSLISSGDAYIYLLFGIYAHEAEEVINNGFIPILNHMQQIKAWQKYLHDHNKQANCAIHINTGMHRLGMLEDELLSFIDQQHNLNVKLVMSHLANSDEVSEINIYQLKKLKDHIKHFPGSLASIANSGGIFLGKEYHLDLVRPGAAIYGLQQLHDMHGLIQSPIKLFAPIIQIQKIPANSSIGYNMSYFTSKDSIIATLPIGYADGYSRSLSNIGKVYIDNIEVSVVGRISMDLITIDVTNLDSEKIFLGKLVEIIGNNCTVDKLAANIGTIGYEGLTSLGQRFQRNYIDYD